MRLLLTMFFIIAFALSLLSQQLVRQSIGCMGNQIISKRILLRQTAGQSSPTEIIRNGRTSIYQGFQQPISKSIIQNGEVITSFSVYPNPCTSHTTLTIQGKVEDLYISISDLMGKRKKDIKFTKGTEIYLSTDDWNSGVYILSIRSKNKEVIGTSKIIKM